MKGFVYEIWYAVKLVANLNNSINKQTQCNLPDTIMPRYKFECCCEAYAQFKTFHTLCNKCRHGENKTGAFLSQFFQSVSPFIPQKRYYICYNMNCALNLKNQYHKKKENKTFPETVSTTREERILKRRHLIHNFSDDKLYQILVYRSNTIVDRRVDWG